MKKQAAYSVIRWFERAVRTHENIGAQPPEDRPKIQRTYEAARKRMASHLTKGE